MAVQLYFARCAKLGRQDIVSDHSAVWQLSQGQPRKAKGDKHKSDSDGTSLRKAVYAQHIAFSATMYILQLCVYVCVRVCVF